MKGIIPAIRECSRKIETARMRRRKMFLFYRRYIQPGDLCFNVGANVGNRTEILLRLGATVVAVEPQAECRRQIQANLGADNRLILIPTALGEREGSQPMMLCSSNTLSSMSPEWITCVRESGRFAGYTWERTIDVPVTTLDALIARYGVPDFCKIDVEGYEYEVIKGLSRPVRMLAFEFTPERIGPALEGIRRLAAMGMKRFNYSVGESMVLSLFDWTAAERMCEILERLPDKSIFGDVYACGPDDGHRPDRDTRSLFGGWREDGGWKDLLKETVKLIVRRSIVYAPLRQLLEKRRQAKEFREWVKKGKPVPIPHLAKQSALRCYAERHGLKVLVETGTYLGDMVDALRKRFTRIYSIELSDTLYRKAAMRFKDHKHIRIIHGDSGRKLKELMTQIDRPALFWLDGHYSAGVTARGDMDTPILEELRHILDAPDLGHVIVIDDARRFGTDPAYPTIEAVKELVRSRRPDARFAVEDDSIRITPGKR